jgi:hypothetical protein
MKLQELFEGLFQPLHESLQPFNANNIERSTVIKTDRQGSEINITQLQFTTAKGNNVKIFLKPSIINNEKSVDISFYVNNDIGDNSTLDKENPIDRDIIPQVFNSVFEYFDDVGLNHATFYAISSAGDTKKLVTKNRRFSIYSHILQKYYPNWNVKTIGNSFELTRK